MPASKRDGAGMRRHFAPRNGAAESFVSFIPLFDDASLPPLRVGANNSRRRQIVPLIRPTLSTYATREGVARRIIEPTQQCKAATPLEGSSA